MMAQVTAAALVSECKTLAHPASVDSIPTSAGREDHVSMGTWAARKLATVVENARLVLAVEAARGGAGARLQAAPALVAGARAGPRDRSARWPRRSTATTTSTPTSSPPPASSTGSILAELLKG